MLIDELLDVLLLLVELVEMLLDVLLLLLVLLDEDELLSRSSASGTRLIGSVLIAPKDGIASSP